jgi:hypothetical protein
MPELFKELNENPIIGLGVNAKRTAKGYRITYLFLYCEKNSVWAATFIN